jgi:hypothetical protein
LKINRRTAISQSMDLFIIIAAVLGVGGVVSASVYNLVNSATSNSSIAVVGVSLRAGATSPTAISVSVKNDGGSPITCTGQACQVVVAGTSVAAPSCTGSCLVSGGPLSWVVSGTTGPLTFYATGSGALAPGEETSFVVNGPLPSGTYWSAGQSVTLNVLFGSASAQVTVVSQ